MHTFTIRCSDELAEALAQNAWVSRTSINKVVVGLIRKQVDFDRGAAGEATEDYGRKFKVVGERA